jgi:hypothetical protein
MLVLGGYWSAYWYNGSIYGSEIARGLDVFQLTPTKFLTQNEIDAAKTVQVAELNVQNQQKMSGRRSLLWPRLISINWRVPQSLPAKQIADLQKAIKDAEKSHLSASKVAKLTAMTPAIESSVTSAKSPADVARMQALVEILKHPAA